MIKFLAKSAIAGGLLYWLFQSGKIDLNILKESLEYKSTWLITIGLLCTNIFISSYRWKLILQVKSDRPYPYLQIVKLTWIGLLFNTVLPGAVTGDLIKLVYAKDLDKKLSKTFLIMSAFLDRIFGLFGLLTLLGISSIMFYGELVEKSPKLKVLVHFNFMIFTGMILFLASLFLHNKVQKFILEKTAMIPKLGRQITKTLTQIWDIGRDKKTVFTAIGLSIITQFFNISAFWIISSPFFTEAVSIKYAFTFIPLGLVSIAIPITPAGLGVGHAIFDSLFRFFGVNNGASLFNFYFIANTLMNLTGFIPYVTAGKKHTLDEAHEFEEVAEEA